MKIKQISDNEIEIDHETKSCRTKDSLFDEKKMIERELQKVNELLSYFKE